jgi:Phosphoinositide phospholipase C, Ca2+-dependent
MNPRENISYNKAVFMNTHNSYAPKIKASVESQLDQGIRGIELDIHNPHIENLQRFSIGHVTAGGDVYHKAGNPKSDLFDDWLQIIKRWSDKNNNHEPITLFVDIKSDLVENSPDKELILLNKTITNVLTQDKLYMPQDLTKFNNNQRLGVKWPSLAELRNKIIVVLTGNQSKWHYWKTLAQEANCFVAYTYPEDNEESHSKDILKEVKFVNAEAYHWEWTNPQLNQDKIVRFFSYNPRKSTIRRHIKYPLDRWPEALCNLPATDYPFKYSRRNPDWYQETVEILQNRLLQIKSS